MPALTTNLHLVLTDGLFLVLDWFPNITITSTDPSDVMPPPFTFAPLNQGEVDMPMSFSATPGNRELTFTANDGTVSHLTVTVEDKYELHLSGVVNLDQGRLTVER
jgi:hypothetical protein